jgi:hypothetical protein
LGNYSALGAGWESSGSLGFTYVPLQAILRPSATTGWFLEIPNEERTYHSSIVDAVAQVKASESKRKKQERAERPIRLKRSRKLVANPRPKKEQAPKEPKPDKAGTNLFKDRPPPYRGSFRGESITVEVKIETGKFRYIPTTPQQRAKMKAEGKEPREVVRIPILRSEIMTYWIWSGSEWLRPDVFLVRYAEQIKKERLLPHEGEISKFDVSGIGELIRGRTRHEAAPPKPREKKSSMRPGPSDPKERRRLAKILQMFSPNDED